MTFRPAVLALAFLTFGCVTASAQSDQNSGPCPGTQIQGPWYSFTLPEGTRLDPDLNAQPDAQTQLQTDSVWIESGSGPTRILFFLYAPQHGGKPYPAYLGADRVTKLKESPNGAGPNGAGISQTFIVDYQDGSTGLFEGTSQRLTGLRVYDRPLDGPTAQQYECFLNSIESYAD